VWAAAVLLLVLAGLLSVPEVRAGIGRLLRIGAIEIVPATPTPSVAPQPQASELVVTATPHAPRSPRPTPTLRSDLLALAGETTLQRAQEAVRFPLKVPAYPADLGPPDRVFLQDLDGDAVILVWLQPDQPDQARLALFELTSQFIGRKSEPKLLDETTVNRQRALWMEGPHMLQFLDGRDYGSGRLVTGNVLLWTQNGITYRLESGVEMEEAVKIAESLIDAAP